MGGFTLDPKQIDVTETVKIVCGIIGAVGATVGIVVGVISANRGKKRPHASVKVHQTPFEAGNPKRRLEIQVTNDGTHPFTLLKIEGITPDASITKTIYSGGADPKTVAVGDTPNYVLEGIEYLFTTDIVVTTNSTDPVTTPVTEREMAETNYRWLKLVEAVVRHMMKGQITKGGGWIDAPTKVYYPYRGDTGVTLIFNAFNTRESIGGFNPMGTEAWAEDQRNLGKTFSNIFAAQQNGQEMMLNWHNVVTMALMEDDRSNLKNIITQTVGIAKENGVPLPPMFN